MIKITIGLICISSMLLSGLIFKQKNQELIEVEVVNKTQENLESVRLEVGVLEKTSETRTLAQDEIFEWNFKAKKATHLRLQYQNSIGEEKDLIVHGYIEPNSSGKIQILVQKQEEQYKITISQSIRK
ncbi:MAG: hypothetical protein ACRC3A_08580 [Culicoidibacterales bacterium]